MHIVKRRGDFRFGAALGGFNLGQLDDNGAAGDFRIELDAIGRG